MVDLIAPLVKLEAEILELQRQAKEEKREAAEKERQLVEQLRVVREAKGAAQALVGGVGIPGGQEAVVRSLPTQIVDPSDEDYGFLWPALDPKTGDPLYDVRVVAGYNTNRERAYAAARVYGRQLREKSLADAIFKTGETSAPDGASARSSLGSLVRYGNEWMRLNGWLYCLGELTCNAEMVRLLTEESSESVEQV